MKDVHEALGIFDVGAQRGLDRPDEQGLVGLAHSRIDAPCLQLVY